MKYPQETGEQEMSSLLLEDGGPGDDLPKSVGVKEGADPLGDGPKVWCCPLCGGLRGAFLQILEGVFKSPLGEQLCPREQIGVRT